MGFSNFKRESKNKLQGEMYGPQKPMYPGTIWKQQQAYFFSIDLILYSSKE